MIQWKRLYNRPRTFSSGIDGLKAAIRTPQRFWSVRGTFDMFPNLKHLRSHLRANEVLGLRAVLVRLFGMTKSTYWMQHDHDDAKLKINLWRLKHRNSCGQHTKLFVADLLPSSCNFATVDWWKHRNSFWCWRFWYILVSKSGQLTMLRVQRSLQAQHLGHCKIHRNQDLFKTISKMRLANRKNGITYPKTRWKGQWCQLRAVRGYQSTSVLLMPSPLPTMPRYSSGQIHCMHIVL